MKLEHVQALVDDLKQGYGMTLIERVHADVFSDMLDMAQELLDNGSYRVPAIVITGSSLEAHLRSLCIKRGVPILNHKGEPLSGGALNDALLKDGAYDKGRHKMIVAWQDDRNQAAHGRKSNQDFADIQVSTMIQGIRGLMATHPA
jgi:hypothetical protein